MICLIFLRLRTNFFVIYKQLPNHESKGESLQIQTGKQMKHQSKQPTRTSSRKSRVKGEYFKIQTGKTKCPKITTPKILGMRSNKRKRKASDKQALVLKMQRLALKSKIARQQRKQDLYLSDVLSAEEAVDFD